jgi:2-C-methyl-D-erythritol 4-phosphate cytidylyltransferase
MQAAFEELAARYGFRKPYRLVAGGRERQDSVWNGLQAVSPETGMVAIQDGARPCTPESLIAETIVAARAVGAAVAARRLTDTIKESDGGMTIVRWTDRALGGADTPTFASASSGAPSMVRRQLAGDGRHRGVRLIQQPVSWLNRPRPIPK